MEYMLPTSEDKIKKGYIVRVLKFIPGKILFDVSPWTAEHFFQAGKFVAKMDKELQVGKRDLYFSSDKLIETKLLPADLFTQSAGIEEVHLVHVGDTQVERVSARIEG